MFSQCWVGATARFYESLADNLTSLIGSPQTTNGSGWAVLSNHNYNLSQGLYAFLVTVDDGEILAINYFDLTVSSTTKLLFGVGKDDTSTLHVVSGRLLSNSQGVANKAVKISVNGTVRETVLTNETGSFSLTMDLQPKNTTDATYSLEAVYEGETPQNVTSYFHTSNDTYPVCTTVYYAYTPSSNSTSLTVSPQSTESLAPTKTPEEMQAEAQQSGWFRVEPEFSWWFPWFRLHYKLDVNLPQGNPKMDYGWSPLPFGESSNANNTALANIMNDATEGPDPMALAEFFGVIAVPFIIQATITHFAGRTLAGIAVATVVYGLFLTSYTALTYVRAQNNSKAWLMTFMSAAFVEMAALFIPVSGVIGIAHFLTAGARWALEKIQHPLQALRAMKLNFFAITSAIFALMDFVVMAFYLLMYIQSI